MIQRIKFEEHLMSLLFILTDFLSEMTLETSLARQLKWVDYLDLKRRPLTQFLRYNTKLNEYFYGLKCPSKMHCKFFTYVLDVIQ